MVKNVISSETIKDAARELYQNIVDSFSLDPVAVIALIKEIVRTDEARCTGDIKYIIQASGTTK